jgi:parallel beta-helix repeat protein
MDVWLPTGNHDLVFDNLELTSNNQLFSACAGCNLPHYNITLKNSYLHNTTNLGVQSGPLDHNWLIESNTIQHTGDSGILVTYSSNITTTRNAISYTGEDVASIGYGTHGIYAKGPNETISYNDFSHNFGGQAVSIRAHGDYIYGNTIHDTDVPFSFFDYDLASAPQGTSYIYDNETWNISGYIFYYDNQSNPNGQPPTVSFVIASNTFALSSNGSEGQAFNLSKVPSNASVTMANNIVSGSYGVTYAGCSSCSEYNNDWHGGTSGIPSGNNDLFVNPNLSVPSTFSLPAGSPLIDKGTANVPGLTYIPRTDGQPLHYAGSAPDMGAVESP